MVGRLSISEQAYDAIKAQLLEGAYRPGERLEAAVLAERYFWSITPVRAALARLAGERFIEARSNEGFMAPLVTESSLRALYDLSRGLLGHALKLASTQTSPVTPRAPEIASWNGSGGASVLRETEQLFVAIGAAGNVEYARAVVLVTERLRTARRLEPQLIPDLDGELATMQALLAQGAHAALDRAIGAYHKRRVRLAATLVAMLQQDGAPARN